jgi:hypothetical protein
MRNWARIALLVALMTMAAQFSAGNALAGDHDRNSWGDRDHHGDHGVHGAPGPIAGAGLPFLAVGYGVYWLARRRRKAQ